MPAARSLPAARRHVARYGWQPVRKADSTQSNNKQNLHLRLPNPLIQCHYPQKKNEHPFIDPKLNST